MNIGIEQNTKLIYEATSNHGIPITPSPVMLQVVIASEDDEEFTAASYTDLAPNSLLFREETYNSSSRVRRGRLYKGGPTQPVQWHVYPHPALGATAQFSNPVSGITLKMVYEFSSFRLRSYLAQNNLHRPLFILGAEDSFTVWTLVNIETSATGDEHIILRARKSIGALPHLDREKILSADGQSVLDYVDKLEEELYRAGPESVVDRSREAATAILSKYLQSIGMDVKDLDLSRLAPKAAEAKKFVVENSAKIIALLHARGKHVEQEKRKPRYITEQDAEFAVQAVGIILCDLEWGSW